jgi:hypothetical protein
MVQKYDCEERGVGKQNFQYAPAWEEMCHIIRIHSPRAYRSLKEYLPMPDERTLRCVFIFITQLLVLTLLVAAKKLVSHGFRWTSRIAIFS